MLLPKHHVSWKSAKASLLGRAVSILARPRSLAAIFVLGLVTLLWRSTGSSDLQRFYCFGPTKPPMRMSANEHADWTQHLQTPVIFNHHEPLVINESTISFIDLNPIRSTTNAISNQERVLVLTPLRDSAYYLPKYFDLISQFSYPHHLIDLGFLIGDSYDDTLAVLTSELKRVQDGEEPFNSAMVISKDFGAEGSQDVEDRHGFKAQGPRRKLMGRARNYLLASTLKPEHSWVYWRDVDISDSPEKIIEDFIAHDRDVIVPNVWFHRYENGIDIEGRFDYNSWVESEQGLRLAASLPKDTVIAEGYKEFATGRDHMALMGNWRNNKDEELELDGIGGVSILVKADVHRSGVNFPAYSFENQAESEGFAKMCKRAGYNVYGLPNYVIWHTDTDEKPGNV